MDKSCLGNICILQINLLVGFVVILSLLLPGSLKFASALGNETDRIALLSIKDQLVGAYPGALDSWNASLHFCEWQGVTCGRRHQRVTALELSGLKLAGSLSPSIGNLTFLRRLNLSDNRLKGNIPKEVGYLRRLLFFELSSNNLHGKLPLGDLSKLIRLSLDINNLVGVIPSSLGNLSSLSRLSLAYNHLEGNIPDALGRALNLRILFLGVNSLTGTVPLSIHNLSSLEMIDLAMNNLTGSLAVVMGGMSFPNLRVFSIAGNQLIGTIPRSISNMSKLEIFSIVLNGISGSVPNDVGNLKNLQQFRICGNYFGNGKAGDLDFLSSLSNCSRLKILALDENRLGGLLPESIGNLSIQLNKLSLAWNLISGNIPDGIGNLVNLILLDMRRNALTGTLPTSIGKLKNLETLLLGWNNFSGEIPSFIGNLSRLFELILYDNNFEGRIPLALRNCKRIQNLDLGANKHSGSIPEQLLGAFTGNFFQGGIPLSFGSLKSLEFLDLSRNNLSGTIPHELEELPFLSSLNLSFNHLEGEVPKGGIFNKSSGFSIVGNKNLCGGIFEIKLPKCFNQKPRKMGTALSAKAFIFMILGILIASILVVFLLVRCCKQRFGKKLIPAALFEYGMSGAVSPEGDIYSYGILLLEMITGRRPTDGIFHGGLSLHNFCKMALPERLKEILDFRLLNQISENNERARSQLNIEGEVLEGLVSFTKIGVACSAEAPGERMGIKDAITQLLAIKARLLRTGIHTRDRR
ncbi:hypothetical protein SCA6_000179 [Theobroma cacao]